MKIVFLGLASTFTESMSYQDNVLCKITVEDGHQVTYISNPEKFVDGRIVYVGAEDKILPDGMRLVRLPYVNIGPYYLRTKLRIITGVYTILNQVQPDVIFCHNTQYWSVLDVVRYKREHPATKVYADTHTASYNSATNWLSLHVLHRIYYKCLTNIILPYLEKYFYIGEAERQFSVENYGVPESLMEFYPLGGIILSKEDYLEKRSRRRAELNIGNDELLLVHSGKLDVLKRTEDLLKALVEVPDFKAKLVIIGSIPDKMKPVLEPLIAKDGRVQYLGWKTGADLQEYLCAGDLYCQPGGVSSTLQNAVCCNSPILSYPHEAYTKDFDYGNIIWVETLDDIIQVFRALHERAIDLDVLKSGSVRCARELLDYRVLAARLYN